MQQTIRTLLVGFVIGTLLGIIGAYLAGSGYFVNWVKLSPPDRVVFVELVKSQGGQLFVEGSDGRSYVCDRFDMFGFLYKPNDCKQREPVTLGDAEIEFLKPCDRATVPFSWFVGPPAGITDCVQDRTFFRTARRHEASDSAYVLDHNRQLWGWHHPLPFQGRPGYLALFVAAYFGMGSAAGLYMANLAILFRGKRAEARKLLSAVTPFAICNILLIWFIYSPFEKDSLPWLLIALIPVTYAMLVAPAELLGPKWPRNIAIETIIFYVGLGLADWLTPSADSGGWILFALLAIVVPIVTSVIRAPDPSPLPRWVRFVVGVGVGEGFLWFTFQILIFFLSLD